MAPGLHAALHLPAPDAERAVATARYERVFVVSAVVAWALYLIAVPVAWARWGPVAILAVPTAGIYLFSWLLHYQHELWHQYFPGLNNRRWFLLVSYLLFAFPRVFELAHPTHHKFVHTPDDLEFFPQDWRTDRRRRRREFLLECVFGNVAWYYHVFFRLRRERRLTMRESWIATGASVAVLAPLAAIAGGIERPAAWLFVPTYLLTIWLGAVVVRHMQWIEHLGIVSAGSLEERNALTRNLPRDSVAGWIFNVMSHDGARDHVFHHTDPKVHSRAVEGLALPPGAQVITLAGYARVIGQHYRAL